MILKFYGKILFICLLGFSIFSCDKVKETSVANGKPKPPSQETPPPKTEDEMEQEQEQEDKSSLETEQPQNKDPVTEPNTKDSQIPGSTSLGGTERAEESKSMSDDGDGLSPTTGRAKAVGTAPDPKRGVIADSSKVGGKEAPQKSVIFPQKENWRFTLEQVANFEFIRKGGSDVFYYYIQFWLNNLKKLPQSMDESKIHSLIKRLSFRKELFVYSNDESQEEEVEGVLFLQGQLAPKDWDRWEHVQKERKNNESGKDQPPHIKLLLRRIDKMKQKNVRKIAVNLPYQIHTDPLPFMLLGIFIREQEIDLHIVGGCEQYCATYLVPAAKTVYIEPYGYIYRKGISNGLLKEIQGVVGKQKQKHIEQLREEWFSRMTREGQIKFAVNTMMFLKSNPESRVIFSQFQRMLGVLRPKQLGEFQEKFTKLQSQGKLSIFDWTPEELQSFIGDFSPPLLENLVLFFRLSFDDREFKIASYIRRLEYFSSLHRGYFGTIQIVRLVSQNSYSYIQLGFLFDLLLKDERYAEYFSVPRNFYNIPEKDKPYKWVIPSAELLRSVGVDIKGENNVDMMDLSYILALVGSDEKISPEQFLYLDSERMENCRFFDVKQSYTTEILENCLSKSDLPQKFLSFQKQERTFLDVERSFAFDLKEQFISTKGAGLIMDQIDFNETRDEKPFSVNEDWKLTLQQVVDFDFIKKGGTDLFYYYIQSMLGGIHNFLEGVDPNNDYAKNFKKLCHESDCSRGVDPQQAAKFGMPFIIRLLSSVGSITIKADNPDVEESVFFLQGNLAPIGWDSWPYIKERAQEQAQEQRDSTSPQPVENILMLNRWMEKYTVKKIAVNLSPQFHEDPGPFMTLGAFIKEQEIDLHIVGGCGHYCAAYLLPAAKTVYIEPYGYIYHKGNFQGLLKEVEEIWTTQGEKYFEEITEQWLPNLTKEQMVDFIAKSITASTNGEDTTNYLLTALREDNAELHTEFQKKIGRFDFEMRGKFFNATKEEMEKYIQGFSEELLRQMTYFLKLIDISDKKIVDSADYYERLKHFSQSEDRYYSVINTQGLPSEKHYSYTDFFMLSASLLKDKKYVENFSVPRPFYNIPEEDKPYEWVVPSAELLRSLGIDVRGENNKEMINDPEFLSLLDLPEENILYLDSQRIENCGFFKENASAYTTERIKECLVQE